MTGASTDEPRAEEILASGPSGGDLDSALTEPRHRGGGPSSTKLLVVGVLLAAGFLGGLLVGRATAPESAAFSGTPGDSSGGGTVPGEGNLPAGPGFGGDGGFTAGTVTRVDGDTIFVETVDGETVEVRTSGDTDIQVSSEGTVADLDEGSTVVVQGSANDDGTIDATSIVEGGLDRGPAFGGS